MSLVVSDNSKLPSYLRSQVVDDFASPRSFSDVSSPEFSDSSFQFRFAFTGSRAFVVELGLDRMHSSSQSHALCLAD